MANMTNAYTDEEISNLVKWKASGVTWPEIAKRLGRSQGSAQQWWFKYGAGKPLPKNIVKESPYPRYDNPLKMVGDALVIPDIEIPFHHADFVNHVLELAQVWGIKRCILAGDVLHFDSISSWEPNWMDERQKKGMGEEAELALLELANKLPVKYGSQLNELIEKLDGAQDGDPNISEELGIARRTLRVFSDLFDEVHFVLGNHEGRFLKALESPMFPGELLHLLDLNEKWKISPFYYSLLESQNGIFRVTHPKSAAKMTASKQASKNQQHVLCAHSHRWMQEKDVSGSFWAISMGCCVDEARLAYVGQRDNNADKHLLGAVIVRDGYPWLLGEDSQWKWLAKCK
jgi:hypothetical protein